MVRAIKLVLSSLSFSNTWRLGLACSLKEEARMRRYCLLVLPIVLFACNPSPSSTVTPSPALPSAPEAQAATTTYNVYTDALVNAWANWSWGSTINSSNTAPKYAGTNSLAVTYTSAWAGAFLHNDTPVSPANRLRFSIHGGTAGAQKVRVMLADSGGTQLEPGAVLTLKANAWTQYDLPFTSLGNPDAVSGIIFQDTSGTAQPVFYLDAVALAQVGAVVVPPPLALSVDTSTGRHVISSQIYGINFANETVAKELRLPVRRWGGNSTSRYNYLQDATNRANDYYFENIPETNTNPAALPAGSAANKFIDQNKRTGTSTLMTMPMIGYVAKSRDIVCGFSALKYAYTPQDKDPYRTDCGNGIKTDGTKVTGNDPLDTSMGVGPTFVEGWVNYLKQTYGPASAGGVQIYNLDNEPGIWHDTHRDVHPQGMGYDELKQKSIDYANAIKRADPSAQIAGPAEWGWVGYMYSGKDVTDGGATWWDTRPDRRAHSDMELTAWYLQQMKAAETTSGKRLLDYLDLHFYPQGTSVYSENIDAATRALRLRSTRALWDTTYTDESWIAQPVNLIPRMKNWIAQNYPGTKIAIGEYSFGATNNINGAIAEADALGIFGREAVDMALLWPSGTWPLESMAVTSPVVYAFRMFRNYDGLGAAFGDTSVNATSASQDKVAVYAATRTDGALTVMVVNKREAAQSTKLTLTGTTATTAKVFRYDASNPSIQKLANAGVTAGSVSLSLPASSITLLELK